MHQLHIALNVQDLEESTAFYQRVFDLAPDKKTPTYVRFSVPNPALVLSLNTKAKVRPGERVSHLGVRLEADGTLEAFRGRMSAAGLVEREEDAVLCCHAIQDKVWIRDPDGNQWEFYELLEDLEPGAAPSDRQARGCC